MSDTSENVVRPTDEQAKPDYAALHEAQRQYCKSRGAPHFVPRVCWGCHREVYSHPRAAEMAATGLMTGCYHCHKSYCD